jgi:hypothetical protein
MTDLAVAAVLVRQLTEKQFHERSMRRSGTALRGPVDPPAEVPRGGFAV